MKNFNNFARDLVLVDSCGYKDREQVRTDEARESTKKYALRSDTKSHGLRLSGQEGDFRGGQFISINNN